MNALRTFGFALLAPHLLFGCREKPEASPAAEVQAVTDGSAKAQCEDLFNAALPFGTSMLQKNGEFFPYAMARTRSGEPTAVAVNMASDKPDSLAVIAELEKALRSGASTGAYVASAVVSDVRLKTGGDAMSFALEHASGYGVTLHIPYTRTPDGNVTLGEAVGSLRDNTVFVAK